MVDLESSVMGARRIEIDQACCLLACFLLASCPFTDRFFFLRFISVDEFDGQSLWSSARVEVAAFCTVVSVYMA